MNISRKDFFRESLSSIGKAVFSVKDALTAQAEVPLVIADAADYTPTPQEDQLAVAYNEFCLAKNCGCFACVERCQSQAIKLIPGIGIRINPQLCIGCGSCEYVCPVTPKAVRMQPRATRITSPSALSAELQPKGETSC